MPQLADITLFSLTRTMSVLDQLFQEEPDLYEDFVREICAEFTLAKEYMLAIQEMANREADRETPAGIAVAAIPAVGLGEAINDRLKRAAGFVG